jgi:hypothetical protein
MDGGRSMTTANENNESLDNLQHNWYTTSSSRPLHRPALSLPVPRLNFEISPDVEAPIDLAPQSPRALRPDERPAPIRRPSTGRRGSFASIRSFGPLSPSASVRLSRPPSPAPPILPDISTENLWEDIEGTSLSIEYFKSNMKRFVSPDKPEPQSVLDFSLLHFINIRHLEHLLYAELNWYHQAIEKTEQMGNGEKKDQNDAVDDLEERYPSRLKSIQTLLNQYCMCSALHSRYSMLTVLANAVRDFEDMRNRPVKSSVQVTLGTQSALFTPPPQPTPRRSSSFFKRSNHHRSSTKSTSDITPMTSPTTPTPFEKAVNRALAVNKAVNQFGRPVDLQKRRADRREMRVRLSNRSLAGTEDWEKDFHNQAVNHKAEQEEYTRKQVEAFKQKMRRFAMAVAGGIALIVPVVVMSCHQSLTWSLATTSIATVLFAIFITLYSRAEEKDILAATAAYAAVLVVFIGTSLSQSAVPQKGT